MGSTRDALEAALAANPGDVAIHSAYADLLAEDGDPRGEYIRLQLALEDRAQPADRLRAMEQEAKSIRERHEREWLGPLAAHVFPDRRVRSVGDMVADGNVEVGFRRGWVHRCRCQITDDGARALAACPAVADLEYLHLDNNYLTPAGIDALAAVDVQVSERQLFAVEWDPDDPDDPNTPIRGEDIPF